MRNSRFFGYSLLAFSLIILISIPPKKIHRIRSSLVAKALNTQKKVFLKASDKTYPLREKIRLLEEENATLKHLLDSKIIEPNAINTANIAKVIFRDPAFWASSVLINKGMRDDSFPIEKNSPVLSNGYLVGIVEEVFETFSKVRLITDKNLQFSIKKKTPSQSPSTELIEVGTLCGISSIDNRYRFRHVEGVFFSSTLQAGDSLVTSGLDGIFPEGLPVAEVTEIKNDPEEVVFPFKALVTAPDLKDLKVVTVLKPISFQQ